MHGRAWSDTDALQRKCKQQMLNPAPRRSSWTLAMAELIKFITGDLPGGEPRQPFPLCRLALMEVVSRMLASRNE